MDWVSGKRFDKKIPNPCTNFSLAPQTDIRNQQIQAWIRYYFLFSVHQAMNHADKMARRKKATRQMAMKV